MQRWRRPLGSWATISMEGVSDTTSQLTLPPATTSSIPIRTQSGGFFPARNPTAFLTQSPAGGLIQDLDIYLGGRHPMTSSRIADAAHPACQELAVWLPSKERPLR